MAFSLSRKKIIKDNIFRFHALSFDFWHHFYYPFFSFFGIHIYLIKLQECCYSLSSVSLELSAHKGGHLFLYHPLLRRVSGLHQIYDKQPLEHCCVRSDLCHLYIQLRPVDRCFRFVPPRIGKFETACFSQNSYLFQFPQSNQTLKKKITFILRLHSSFINLYYTLRE